MTFEDKVRALRVLWRQREAARLELEALEKQWRAKCLGWGDRARHFALLDGCEPVNAEAPPGAGAPSGWEASK